MNGAIVRPGQLLSTIDPRPFTAALAEARAGVATAQSELALAETNLARGQRLLAEEAVSQSSVDQLIAKARSARAALAAAQARVQARALDVEFTNVRAPIGGRISDRRVDPGNLVSAGDAGGNAMAGTPAVDDLYAAGAPPLIRITAQPPWPLVAVGGASGGNTPPEWCGPTSGDLAYHPLEGVLYASLQDCACGGDALLTVSLATGEVLIAEAGQPLQVIGRGSALWLAVRLPAPAWQAIAGGVDVGAGVEPALLPALHEADRALRRAAIRLLREAGSGDGGGATAAAAAFASLLGDLQSEFRTLIARCPGRTHAQRRNVFLRLLRVRNYMAASCHLDLGIDDFARMASYSPCHFIRAFNTVFGDTPHAVLVEQRLTRARRLVNESSMAITEIARASGFENRCAFSRSFKRRFGVTATSLRVPRRAAA